MELLGEFYEKDADIVPDGEIRYQLRKAARAVVLNHAREIAFIYVSKNKYHKLPGGGVERGEDLKTAIRREAKEEIGGEIAIGDCVGATIEYRDSIEQLQISYCFLADLVGDTTATDLTDEEKSRGFELDWVDIDYAIHQLETDAPSDVIGHFIKQRDLAFLRRAKEMMEAGASGE